MIKKRFSKKFIIKGVATALVVLLPFSFKTQETKAVAGVDDAILFGIASVLLGVGTASAIGLTGKSCEAYFCDSGLGSNILQPFENLKDIYDTTQNFVALPVSIDSFLTKFSNDYKSKLGQEYSYSYLPSETLEYEGVQYYPLSYQISNYKTHIFTLNLQKNTKIIKLKDGLFDSAIDYLPSGKTEFYTNFIDEWYRLCWYGGFTSDSNMQHSSDTSVHSYQLLLPLDCFQKIDKYDKFKELQTDLSRPATINLDKEKTEAIALDYVTKYPEQNEDNNGDGKPDLDYSTLIPFIFDVLNKDLGNGEITPQTLANNNFLTYTLKNGSVIGSNPYNPSNSSNSDFTVNNNINISNGSEVTEEEKNGILNLLDNGVRKTTVLLNNLKNSMSNLGNTLQGLFDLLPEPVGYLFYSALCLCLIFFILSLRR